MSSWKIKWFSRNLELTLPQLTLDYAFWDNTNNLLSPAKFTQIMYQILTLHSGPLTKFTLSFSELKKYPRIGSSIYFLSRKDIQDLVLEFSELNRYWLPPSFFSLSQLRHLTLQNRVICPPPTFKGFDMLNKPEPAWCHNIFQVTRNFNPLLLEKLVLKISDTPNHIRINAPNSISFDFSGCIKYISLSNVPRLSKLSLPCQESLKESEKCDFDKFFQLLPVLWASLLGMWNIPGKCCFRP